MFAAVGLRQSKDRMKVTGPRDELSCTRRNCEEDKDFKTSAAMEEGCPQCGFESSICISVVPVPLMQRRDSTPVLLRARIAQHHE